MQLLHSVYKEQGLLGHYELCSHSNYEDTKHVVTTSINHIIYVNPYLTLQLETFNNKAILVISSQRRFVLPLMFKKEQFQPSMAR